MKSLAISLIFLTGSCLLSAQSIDQLMEEGLHLEQNFKTEAALNKFETVLKLNPNHIKALVHASRMTSNLAGHIKNDEAQKKKLHQAEVYAGRAIQLDSASVESHFSMIVTLGLQSEAAGNPRDKIKSAKIIKTEAETILRLDSTYALAYFVLGKWHQELAKLNWFEKVACELFFGGLPEGISMNKAVIYFQRALLLEPENILFLYGQAIVFQYQGRDAEAIQLLEKALRIPLKDPDDALRKEKCEKLLKELK